MEDISYSTIFLSFALNKMPQPSLRKADFAQPSAVVGEYLHSIYRISWSGGSPKAKDLARRLRSSPSTVHATLTRLKRDALIEIDQHRRISLTPSGRQQAEAVTLRHNLAEYFLFQELDIPWYQLHLHAEHLEHALTPLVTEQLAERLGHPKYCPHGSPMPGGGGKFTCPTLPLSEVLPGAVVELLMLDEMLENSEEVMKHLQTHALTPGRHIRVSVRSEEMQTLALHLEEEQHPKVCEHFEKEACFRKLEAQPPEHSNTTPTLLSYEVASHILVTPVRSLAS